MTTATINDGPFYAWDQLDRRWHLLRAWRPIDDTWVLWCQPTRSRRIADHDVVTEPGLPLCQDCRSRQAATEHARTHLAAGRAHIAARRRNSWPLPHTSPGAP